MKDKWLENVFVTTLNYFPFSLPSTKELLTIKTIYSLKSQKMATSMTSISFILIWPHKKTSIYKFWCAIYTTHFLTVSKRWDRVTQFGLLLSFWTVSPLWSTFRVFDIVVKHRMVVSVWCLEARPNGVECFSAEWVSPKT